MRESYREGLANYPDPESCVATRKGRSEALTGVRAGQVLSREMRIPGSRRFPSKRKATPDAPIWQGAHGPRAVEDPVHARKHLVGSWEIPRSPAAEGAAGRKGKSKDNRQ
jgi:RNA-directed DNA polymerase